MLGHNIKDFREDLINRTIREVRMIHGVIILGKGSKPIQMLGRIINKVLEEAQNREFIGKHIMIHIHEEGILIIIQKKKMILIKNKLGNKKNKLEGCKNKCLKTWNPFSINLMIILDKDNSH